MSKIFNKKKDNSEKELNELLLNFLKGNKFEDLMRVQQEEFYKQDWIRLQKLRKEKFDYYESKGDIFFSETELKEYDFLKFLFKKDND